MNLFFTAIGAITALIIVGFAITAAFCVLINYIWKQMKSAKLLVDFAYHQKEFKEYLAAKEAERKSSIARLKAELTSGEAHDFSKDEFVKGNTKPK